MPREKTVSVGEKKYTGSRIAGRTLRMPGLKPTDYYLFKSAREFFNMDMRQVYVLGLRLIYYALHRREVRTILMEIARDITHEDLDKQERELQYTPFPEIRDI